MTLPQSARADRGRSGFAAPRTVALAFALGLASLAVVPTAALAQSAAPAEASERLPLTDRIIELGRTQSRVQDHLDYLTNHIGHRLTGSPNLVRACDWAVHQFESFGLEATKEQWGEFPVGFVAGEQRGRMFAPEELELTCRTPAWTPGTPGPVRAPAVLLPSTLEELEAVRDALPGAWLVRGGEVGRTNSLREAVEEAVAAAGIAGEVRKGANAIQVFGNSNVDPDDLPGLVSVRLLGSQFDALVERLEAGEDVELEFDIDNRFLPGPFPTHNVIADLRGTEFPDEYVIIGGHIDSWHAATGTNDNGTGVATTMEAARLLALAGVKPRRTIRFMLWSGEEQGLLGSKAWVAAHPEVLPNISAVLVHDRGTNYLSGLSAPPVVADDLRTAFASVFELDGDMPFEISENQGLRRAGGSSDHAAFLREGVPGLFWEQAGRTNYFDFWHTHYDTFDSAVAEYQRHSALVVALGAYGLAELDGLLERDGLFAEGGDGPRRDPGRRRMGVYLSGTEVSGLVEGGMADEAGWLEGDEILTIDGEAVSTTAEIVEKLNEGGPVKKFELQRGEEVIESELDYTGTPSERAREERAAREREEATEG